MRSADVLRQTGYTSGGEMQKYAAGGSNKNNKKECGRRFTTRGLPVIDDESNAVCHRPHWSLRADRKSSPWVPAIYSQCNAQLREKQGKCRKE